MKELIQRWLAGRRSYTYGAILYHQFGDNDKLKGIFSSPKTPYSEDLLQKCLQAMITGTPEENQAEFNAFDKMPDADDSILKALKDEWMPLFTEMNYKRHALDKWLDEDTNEAQAERGKLALQILTLEKQCLAVWAKRDHYLKHGTLPGADVGDQEPVIDTFKAGERIVTLKVYIRRYKGYLKNTPSNAKHALLLKQYEDELNQLKQIHGK